MSLHFSTVARAEEQQLSVAASYELSLKVLAALEGLRMPMRGGLLDIEKTRALSFVRNEATKTESIELNNILCKVENGKNDAYNQLQSYCIGNSQSLILSYQQVKDLYEILRAFGGSQRTTGDTSVATISQLSCTRNSNGEVPVKSAQKKKALLQENSDLSCSALL